jgi:membrane fusion protein (multidrug efflux system)
MKHLFLCIPFLFAACGRPPSGGGGPPPGDFPVNVTGAPVTARPLTVTLPFVGTLVAPEHVSVMAQTQGEVLELPFEEGRRVETGQILARLDTQKAEARLREAAAQLTLAESTLARTEDLRASNNTSEQALDEARAQAASASATLSLLQKELEDMTLSAPMSGILGERNVSVGQIVQPGYVLMELVQIDPLEVRFEVPERQLGALNIGMELQLRLEAFPEEVLKGEVSYIDPILRENTRTVMVKARVANPEGRLRPGMFARVELVLEQIPEALFVPESALMQRGEKTLVMIRNAQGRSEEREVKLGQRKDGQAQIVEGLSAADLVVAEGLIKTMPGMLLNFTENSRRFGLEPSAPPVPASQPQPEG